MIELHRHVDGSLPISFMWKKLQKYQLCPVKTEEELKATLTGHSDGSLLSYLDKFHIPLWITQFYDNIRDGVKEIVHNAAAEGITVLELRWAPMIHIYSGMTVRQTIRAVLDGMNSAQKKYPHMKLGLIIISMRQHGPHIAKVLARQALSEAQHLHDGCGVVGFDLAGAEIGFPPRLFKESFDLARKGRLRLTCHAGEVGPVSDIWEALDVLGVDRIGHGCAAVKDRMLLSRLRLDDIPIEVCLTSNLHTGAVKDLRKHPLLQFHGEVPYIICADNPTISNTTLIEEYRTAQAIIDMHGTELVRQGDQQYSFIAGVGKW